MAVNKDTGEVSITMNFPEIPGMNSNGDDSSNKGDPQNPWRPKGEQYKSVHTAQTPSLTLGSNNNGVGHTHEDAEKFKKNASDLYNRAQRDADLAEHAEHEQEITDSFVNNPEEWFKMYKYWNWNLAKHNPNGNLNNRTYNRTLSMSRLADAFNNSLHATPTDIGHRTLNYGTTGTGVEGATPRRWDAVETQETRQMRENEALDKYAREKQIGLATDVQAYPLETRKLMDTMNRDIAKFSAQTHIDVNNMFTKDEWNEMFNKGFDTAWNMYLSKYTQELAYELKERVYNNMMNMKYANQVAYSSIMGGQAIAPIMLHMYEAIESATSGISDPKERVATTLGALGFFTGMTTNMAFSSFKDTAMSLTTSVF